AWSHSKRIRQFYSRSRTTSNDLVERPHVMSLPWRGASFPLRAATARGLSRSARTRCLTSFLHELDLDGVAERLRILLQCGDGGRVLRLCRFEARDRRLRGANALGNLGLGQAGFGPRPQHFIEEGEFTGRRLIGRPDFGARKSASLELLESARHI